VNATKVAMLGRRAAIVRALRRYLDSEGFVEVQTPLLVRGTTPDVALDSFEIAGAGQLVTSTEYQLKRLAAAGLQRAYTLTQNFRRGERSERHNPEFTMLEWYRVGASLAEIEADAEARHLPSLAARFALRSSPSAERNSPRRPPTRNFSPARSGSALRSMHRSPATGSRSSRSSPRNSSNGSTRAARRWWSSGPPR
jgi:hypothetical protein